MRNHIENICTDLGTSLLRPTMKLLTCAVLMLQTFSGSSAHMMVAQGGTLNFVDNDVFMVLSLPTSAFKLRDTDGNSALSLAEFNSQRQLVSEMIKQRVQLSDQSGALLLEGLMLSPEVDHDSDPEHVSQVVVLGKFRYRESSERLSFSNDLFGDDHSEKEFKMSARRKPNKIEQLFVLVPDGSSQELLVELLDK